jgi:folate-binding protein YgfZ
MPEFTPLHTRTEAAGAVHREEAGWAVPAHFGDPLIEYRAATGQAAVFDCSPRGKLQVKGQDAGRFLHNLCSQDVVGLAPGAGCEAFFLNIKARVLAHVWLYCSPGHEGKDTFWLDTWPGQAERLLKHLDHYLISEQVELADVTREQAQLHLAGPQAPGIAARLLGEAAATLKPLQVIQAELPPAVPVQVRRQDVLGVPGFDLLCAPEQAAVVWDALVQAGARPAGKAAYESLRVEAGTPAYGQDIDDSYLAPEVGRTRQAISYAKGCYLGQEPVVRIRDLGQVNRTLLGLEIGGTVPVPAGAKLFHADAEAGHVTSSAFSARLDAVVALGYIRRGSQEPGTILEVHTEAGPRSAEVTPLPFPGTGAVS